MRRHTTQPVSQRTGFTLVEMMVAVTLVMIMMLMFSTIFQIASGSMGTQRGIAVNDQKARTIATIIRGDLVARTFINVVPFSALETAPLATDSDFELRDFTKRRGYFYISENEVGNGTDDVLQFTIQLGTSQTPMYGHAHVQGIPESAPAWSSATPYTAGTFVQPTAGNTGLVYYATNSGDSDAAEPTWPTTANSTVVDNTVTWRSYAPTQNNRNQPEWDDGVGGNESTSSLSAEVTYFLRNGVLYRRVMLIRAPLSVGGDPQPRDNSGLDYFDSSQPGGFSEDSFWGAFDNAAWYLTTKGGAEFHGTDSLDNDGSQIFALGKPGYRFGFNYDDHQPKEYVDAGAAPADFMGRYTHEETSHDDFQYPHRIQSMATPGDPPNPMQRNPGWDMANNSRQVVSTFYDITDPGHRRGEDILMLNVHSFDVKIWDPSLGKFVDVGNNEVDSSGNPTGVYNQNPTASVPTNWSTGGNRHVANGLLYGPWDATDPADPAINNNRVFDTWYPNFDQDNDTGTGVDDPTTTTVTEGYEEPPFRPAVDNNAIPTPMNTADDTPLQLRAIQITISYHDPRSDQLRQMTIVQSLISE